MDTLVDALIEFLSKEKQLSHEEEIYRYGLRVGIEMSLYVVVCFLISLTIGMIKEFFFFFGILYSVRSYTGGIHMKTYMRCFSVSSVVFVVIMLLTKYFYMNVYLSVCLIILFVYMIYILTVNDEGEIEEHNFYIKKLRRNIGGIVLLSVGLIIIRQYQILTLVALTLMVILLSKIFDLYSKNNYRNMEQK